MVQISTLIFFNLSKFNEPPFDGNREIEKRIRSDAVVNKI